MKLDRHSNLFSSLSGKEDTSSLTHYINKFLSVHPWAGVYEVDDSEYVSPQKQSLADKHFHPSGDCTKCSRLLYLERTMELPQEKIEPRTQAIFKLGAAMHAMIQAWFSEMDKLDGFPNLVGNEVRLFNQELNMGGYIDSIIVMPGQSDETIVEIKSINDRQFQTLSSPKQEHKLQMGCYLMERQAPSGIILYMNKNTCELKEFPIEPMDMMGVLTKWAQVRHAVAKNDPSALGYGCSAGSKEWERCPARDICYRNSKIMI